MILRHMEAVIMMHCTEVMYHIPIPEQTKVWAITMSCIMLLNSWGLGERCIKTSRVHDHFSNHDVLGCIMKKLLPLLPRVLAVLKKDLTKNERQVHTMV